MTLRDIAHACAPHGFDVMGAFHPKAGGQAPKGCRTLVLLGPVGQFWAHFTGTPEYKDGQTDAVDRWSRRIIGALAKEFGAEAIFPFGGPPHAPFIDWALKSGRAWASPVGMLVHDQAGLLVSYRGALALPRNLDLPPAGTSPCAACPEKPCLNACPADAFEAGIYDLPACHQFLDTAAGKVCMTRGCVVRRACPRSQQFDRLEEQSAYHMRYFHKA
jgi:hypothetical protein